MAVKSFIKLASGYLLARGWYLRGLQQRPMDPEHHDQTTRLSGTNVINLFTSVPTQVKHLAHSRLPWIHLQAIV
jgi:hypothetical protein